MYAKAKLHGFVEENKGFFHSAADSTYYILYLLLAIFRILKKHTVLNLPSPQTKNASGINEGGTYKSPTNLMTTKTFLWAMLALISRL